MSNQRVETFYGGDCSDMTSIHEKGHTSKQMGK